MNLEPLFFDGLSAIPQANQVEALHAAYQFKFLNSLINLLVCAENALDKDYQPIIDRLNAIKSKPPRFFSPWLYNLYFKLLECMEKDDIAEVQNCIYLLSTAEEHSYLLESQRIQPGLVEEWERHVFREEARVSFESDSLEAYSPTAYELASFQLCFARATKLITKASPQFLKEIQSLVSTILLVNSPVNVGATSPKFFGAIYISLPEGELEKHHDLLLVDQLVHETSHLYLNAIIAHDPLILNSPHERFSSPIRNDLRPMLGVYHATFVLSRVIRVFKNMQIEQLYWDEAFLMKCINNLMIKYEMAFSTVKNHAVLTKIGKHIFESTQECAFLENLQTFVEVGP